MDADLYVIGFILVVVAIVCVIWYVIQNLGGYFSTEKCSTETDSTEDSPSEVTPAPSPHFMAEFESSGGVKKRETDSTENPSPEVTPAPSRFASVGTRMTRSESNTDLGCLVLTVILFVLAYLWFNSWLKEQKRKSDARKREFQNGVKKWMRLFKGGG